MNRYQSDIYKSMEGKKCLLALYDRQLEKIPVPYTELMVDTRFGRTHLVIYGNSNGEPILWFHGGNATNPYSLYPFVRNMDMTKIKFIVPDTIGNIGYSEEHKLNSSNLDYGKWASDIMEALRLHTACVFGGSYGGGIAIRLASFAPEKVKKLMLVIPSGIANANLFKMIKTGLPTVGYLLQPTSDEKLRKAVSGMTPVINDDFLEMIKLSMLHTKFEMKMPRNATKKELLPLRAPTYVIADKFDCLFPGEAVIKQAKDIFPNLVGTELTSYGGHGVFMIDGKPHPEIYDLMTEFLTC